MRRRAALTACVLLTLGALSASGDASLASVHASSFRNDVTELDSPTLAPGSLGVVLSFLQGPATSDVRVNDPAREGDLAACHVQSETAITSYDLNVYVAFNDGRACLSATQASSTGFARSIDGGRNFEDFGPLPVNGGITELYGDPVLAVDTRAKDSGTVYLASLANTAGGSAIAVGVSRDAGETFTWSAVAEPDPAPIRDKEWIAVDNTGGPYDGTVYAVWFEDAESHAGLRVASSADGAASWSEAIDVVPIETGPQGARLVVDPSGHVHLVWENLAAPRSIMWSVSRDGARTFSPPAKVADVVPTGHQQVCIGRRQVLNGDIRTQEFPSVAVDLFGSARKRSATYNPWRGTLYAAFSSHGEGEDEADVFLSVLEPGETEWSAPLKVNDDDTTTDQFFPEVVATGPGRFMVAWTDRREDTESPSSTGNRSMRQFTAEGRMGPLALGPNEPASDVLFPPPFSNPNTDPLIAPCYAGDYNSLFFDGERVLAAWGDNRDTLLVQGIAVPVIPDPNVYFRVIDLGG